MEGLGRHYDLVAGIAPVDLAAGATTGNRVHLKNCGGLAVVLYKEAGAASEPPILTFQEHNVVSAGTPQTLDVDHYYVKSEATLDGDETWTLVEDVAAGAVTLTGLSDLQAIVVFEIEASSLSDGYEWVSVNIADITTAGQIGGVLYVLRDLAVQRSPVNLANPQA